MVPGPLISELPGSLLQMQIHEPRSRIIQSESPVVESTHLHSPRASQMFLCKKKFEMHHISSPWGSTMMSPRAIWIALLCLGPTLRDSDLIGLGWGLRTEMLSKISPSVVGQNGLHSFITHCQRGRGVSNLMNYFYYNQLKMQIF